MESIAVIGVGCRFPAANGVREFWQLLKNGVDAISEVPKSRWDIEALFDPDHTKPGKMSTRFGGFVDGIELFDPEFFRISPREASRMDPQQRILMEVTWEAMENAGLVPDMLKGSSTGVFVGVASDDYCRLNLSDLNASDAYACTGSTFSIAANRLSYFFDLRGPSLAIDSACSSSLVAIHLACRSLSSGETNLAIAGGVNALLDPALTVNFSRAGFMSPDGRCKAFDATANGYVRGEGAGVVILKRLSQAQADGDPILAIVRGTAVNQDGRSNGLTAPNQGAQIAVLREAYRTAGINPSEVQYIEAHGTGTSLGDPIEARALGAVLCEHRVAENPLVVGSVKSNFGHLEAAAGIAGFIKVVLSLHNGQIPPSLHFTQPNPYIPFDELKLRVQTSIGPWPVTTTQAVAGVSSFGFGGTNAHAVLQQAPPAVQVMPSVTHKESFLALSARNQGALSSLAQSYRELLSDANTSVSLEEVAYNAGARRAHHDHRLALVASSKEEACEKLEAFCHGELMNGMASGVKKRHSGVVFVFPGQGPQWWAMGRQLLFEEPTFKAAIQECDRTMRSWADWSILEELGAEEGKSRLSQAQFVQPVMFAFQYALAALWRSWGIVPSAVIGHSLGEIAAACVAGALPLTDALKIVYHRGRLMQSVAGPGRTAAVTLSFDEVSSLLDQVGDGLSIAAHNSPSSCTIAGDQETIARVLERLQRQGVFCRQLPVDLAFHSQHMDTIRDLLAAELKDLRPQKSRVPIYSTVIGDVIAGEELGADYWRRNVRETVRFSAAIAKVAAQHFQVYLELSPHPVLSANITECLRDLGRTAEVLASVRRAQPERACMLDSLAHFYSQGSSLDWRGLYPSGGTFVQLPTYPFQRERYWLDLTTGDRRNVTRPSHDEGHAFMPRAVEPAFAGGARIWEFELSEESITYLTDHKIQGVTTIPATAFLEMAIATENENSSSVVLTDVEFKKAIFLTENERRTIQVVRSRQDGSEPAVFSIYSRASIPEVASEWTLHCTGKICPGLEVVATEPEMAAMEQCRASSTQLSAESFYSMLGAVGLEYGPCFRGVKRVWRDGAAALGEVSMHEPLLPDVPHYRVHPALLDSCLQVLAAGHQDDMEEVLVPVSVSRAQLTYPLPAELFSFAVVQPGAGGQSDKLTANICLLDRRGTVVGRLEGLTCKQLRTMATMFRPEDSLYKLQWHAQPAVSPPGIVQGSWIVVADRTGVGEELARAITDQGGSPYLVYHDCLNAGALVESLPENLGNNLQGVIYLGSLDRCAPETDSQCLEEAMKLLTGELLVLAQEIGSRDLKFCLVTRGVQPLGDRAANVQLAGWPIWGFGRTLALETPQLNVQLIDLDPLMTDQQALLADIAGSNEDQIAYRGHERFVLRLARTSLSGYGPVEISGEGGYLVTGGFGALGLEAGRWLAAGGAKLVALLGRRAPEKEALDVIERMRKHGTEVHVEIADVSNRDEVAEVFDRIRKRVPIKGVIHAAGALDDAVLSNQSEQSFLNVMKPKMYGAWNLHELTADENLDFFVLFSSVASVLGSPGQTNYAAANAFLDGLAHFRKTVGLPALSINWGPWSEIGMAARQGTAKRLAARGVASIATEDGLRLMSQLLAHDEPQVMAIPVDWRRWTKALPTVKPPGFLTDLLPSEVEQGFGEASSAHHGTRQELLSKPLSERMQILQRFMREYLAKVLKLSVSKVPVDQSLYTMGLDSLIAVEFQQRLQSELGAKIPIAELLRGPSITELSELVAEQLNSIEAVACGGAVVDG